MPLSGRANDPKLEQLARDIFAMFPQCYLCGQAIERFEDADVRVHLQRVIHRERCPAAPSTERTLLPGEPA